MKHKLILKLMIFILVIACMGPFLIRDKEGKPLMTVDKFKWPQISLPKFLKLFKMSPKETVAQKYTPVETEVLSANITQPDPDQEVIVIYTYKDEKGVSHFTDKKPDRDDFKVIYMPVNQDEKKSAFDKIKEKIDVLTKNIKKEKTPSSPPTAPAAPKEPSDFSISDIYTNPAKAINDAKDLKKQVEATYKEREQMMGDSP